MLLLTCQVAAKRSMFPTSIMLSLKRTSIWTAAEARPARARTRALLDVFMVFMEKSVWVAMNDASKTYRRK